LESANWTYFDPTFESEVILNDLDSAWAGHRYFAYDLIANLKPKTVVELGTHRGTSFFAFCQAVKDQKLDCSVYAVDNWKGDPHASFYGEEVYDLVKDITNKFYSSLQTHFLRMNFDEAVDRFDDKSIDLLHIDGYHTYEVVRHDFGTWISKISDNGFILFHDTSEKKDDFGVFRFWDELKKKYKTIEFYHSHGLGILIRNPHAKIIFPVLQDVWTKYYSLYYNAKKLSGNLTQKENEVEDLRKALGSSKQDVLRLSKESKQKENLIQEKENVIQEKENVIQEKENVIQEKENVIQEKANLIQSSEQTIYDLYHSYSWKFTKPLRWLHPRIFQLFYFFFPYGSKRWAIIKRMVQNIQRIIFSSPRVIVQNLRANLGGVKMKRWTKSMYHRYKNIPNASLILRSGLFDANYYLRRYTDVKIAKIDPFEHYMFFGWREGRNPSPQFHNNRYLNVYQDIKVAGLNPLEHYVLYGAKEGRQAFTFPVEPSFNIFTQMVILLCLIPSTAIVYGGFFNSVRALAKSVKLNGFFQGFKSFFNKVTQSEQGTFNKISKTGRLKRWSVGIPLTLVVQIRKKGSLHAALSKACILIRRQGLFRAIDGIQSEEFYSDIVDHISTNETSFKDTFPARYFSKDICLKVLFVSHDASITGAPVLLLNIMQWLKHHAVVDMHLLLLHDGPLLPNFKECCPVMLCPDANPDLLELKEFCAIPDLIYANTIASVRSYESLSKMGIPIITHVHELERVIHLVANEEILKTMTTFTLRYIAASESVRQNLIVNHGIENSQTCTINDFISIDNIPFPIDKKELRRQFGLPEEGFLVVGCGMGSWRKGVDLFIEVAQRVIVGSRLNNVHFCWIGDILPDIGKFIDHEKMVQEFGIIGKISFTGFRKDFKDFFHSADLFLLTSREDPFPLVALEACECQLPVICFADAGGMQDFIIRGAGYVVPYEDVDSMAEKVRVLLHDEKLRLSLGENARSLLVKSHTADIIVPQLLVEMRRIASKPHPVSVIVPNFNYARYLDQRLQSIFNQSFRDFEVIILDDASTDNSIEVLSQWKDRPGTRLVRNKKNSGNVFKQWIKGLKEAKGDFIWIAEADDFCKEDFLLHSIRMLEDETVGLFYSQSVVIDENNENKGEYLFHTNDISELRWKKDYIRNGVDEIEDTLYLKNTIPNASAVVFRRKYLQGLENVIDDYKMAGDWLSYVFVLKNSKIAFCHLPLNYHRRHSESVFGQANSSLEKATRASMEIMSVQKFILQNFYIKKAIFDKGIERGFDDFKHLTKLSASTIPLLVKKRKEIEEYESTRVLSDSDKNIMIVVSDTKYGGGQLIAIRIASFLAKNNNVYLYTIRPELRADGVENEISNRVVFLRNTDMDVHLQALDNTVAEIKGYINEYNIKYISSHDWLSDKTVFYAISNTKVAWILTMHGYYEDLIERSDKIDIDFNIIGRNVLLRADQIIYTADKNLEVFEKLKIDSRGNLIKILNGYVPQRPYPIKRSSLSISEDAFILTLVGRGIPEKGWSQAIQAVVKARLSDTRDIHLFLIGESYYLDRLKNEYSNLQFIHFLGYKFNLADWIAISDAALFPTYFISESQPLTLIEFMVQGKPIIATDIGEIRNMIIEENKEAGILLHLKNGSVDIDEMTEVIIKLVSDENLYKMMSMNSTELFSRYSMNLCAGNYLKVMDELSIKDQ
jgi:glycosyltransferase involved in cell wall biosynthesis/GT2 family glycosyltransferase